jgi:hypothetical protein
MNYRRPISLSRRSVMSSPKPSNPFLICAPAPNPELLDLEIARPYAFTFEGPLGTGSKGGTSIKEESGK